jgi:hypothetical protein
MIQKTQIRKYQLHAFWDQAYVDLDYVHESFNDPDQVKVWQDQGYASRFTGNMCDMRSAQPTWNQRFIDIFAGQGWQDIGTSYYRMDTGTVLPTHQDRYVKYVSLFGLQGRKY